jgi:glycosyltransferase involved in cell wall biosynthesis
MTQAAAMDSSYFSICVPQYNRTSFLIAACRVLCTQTFKDFELCISDDCSTDGRAEELQAFLRGSGLRFVYRRQETNLRYDGNLRGAIDLASGKYCVLMGNDDCFAGPGSLARLHEVLAAHPDAGVAMCNYEDFDGGKVWRRVFQTGVAGAGPEIAVSRFRNFSFIGGVVLQRDRALAHRSAKWDGSEMYQMYIGCRILAEGYGLLEIEDVLVRRDIAVPGEIVDSYTRRPRVRPCPIVERNIPLGQMGRLVYDAIHPIPGTPRGLGGDKVFLQILLFTYPFWILEYRRVQSWKFAAGICLGMRPRNLLYQVKFPMLESSILRTVYLLVTCAGLFTPLVLFDMFQPKLHAFAKSLFQRP